MKSAKQTILDLLSLTDIQINGSRPFDIQVHNEEFYERVLAEGELGIGESYMDGDWDCEALDVMITKALTAGLGQKIKPIKLLLPVAKAWLVNRQRKTRAFKIGEHHYDIGNDLYHKMLDRRLTYSCAYWDNTVSTIFNLKLDEFSKFITDNFIHHIFTPPVHHASN